MASPEQGSSRPKRPAPMTRQSSSQSHISQSPSEKGHHRGQQHKVAHRHVAGGRMQRTASAGKGMAKFGKGTQHAQHTQHTQTGEESGRHHRRSQSGTSLSAPSSPRPGFRRNQSSGAIMRHNPGAHAHAHAHGGLRKNHSSGHLVGKAKGGKAGKDAAGVKGKLGNPSRSRPASPEERPLVHFDMGDDEDDDDEGGDDDDDDEEGGWTEESASQSPTTTRSNTRSNSVATDTPDAQRAVDAATESNTRANARDAPTTAPAPAPAPAPAHTPAPADLITSRLLQRSASHTLVAPQPSAVSATVPPSSDRLPLGTSVGTLVDTPGRDLVSRFMDGDGSAGTPHDGAYMPARRASTHVAPSSPDDTPTRPQSVKSGATTPNLFPPVTNRTQNKLLLQRAASAIEPHAPVPAILRAAGPSFHNIGLAYPGEGRIDPRLQQQFNHVAIEYRVVQRYRNPLADSIARIQQMPGMLRKLRAASKPGSANGSSASTLGGGENGVHVDAAGRRRSRAGSEADDDVRGLDGEDGERPRNEAQELCRRMWDSAEIVGE